MDAGQNPKSETPGRSRSGTRDTEGLDDPLKNREKSFFNVESAQWLHFIFFFVVGILIILAFISVLLFIYFRDSPPHE